MAVQNMQLAMRAAPPSNAVAVSKGVLASSQMQIMPRQTGTDTASLAEKVAIHEPGQPLLLINPTIRQRVVDIPSRARSVRWHKSTDFSKSERDRESVIELARFLRTNAPPSDNFMSLPHNSPVADRDRKPAFKIFRRQNSRSVSEIAPRHLKLPDSAVAAKTIHGHWHIAISIPIEHDHLAPRPATAKPTPEQNENRPSPNIHEPITVLKPVMEDARPAISKKVQQNTISLSTRPRSASAPLTSESNWSAAVQNNPGNDNNQNIKMPARQDDLVTLESLNPLRSNPVILSPIPSRPQSQRADTQKPGWTNFSIRNIDPMATHSKTESSDSMAINAIRSIYLREGNLPRKQPSTSRQTVDLAKSSTAVQSHASIVNVPTGEFSFRQSVPSTRSKADSVTSTISVPATKLAEVAQSHGSFDTASIKASLEATKTPGPAPTKKLPDLPEDRLDERLVNRRSMSLGYIKLDQKPLVHVQSLSRAASIDALLDEPIEGLSGNIIRTRQNRRERVKALRSRDMAALRATTKYQRVMASVPVRLNREAFGSSPSIEGRLDLPLPNAKRRSINHSKFIPHSNHLDGVISLSPVMLVADLEPCSGSCHPNELNFSFPSPKAIQMKPKPSTHRNTFGKTPTPPRSLTPSLASSDEEDFHGSPQRNRPMSSQSFINRSSPGGEHHAARIRRHLSLQEDNLDSRMEKIEKTNALMLRSLNAVVEMGVGFRELHTLDVELRREVVDHVDRGLDSIEPLMRELQSAARSDEQMIHSGGGYSDY